jgi:hypothetical protein
MWSDKKLIAVSHMWLIYIDLYISIYTHALTHVRLDDRCSIPRKSCQLAQTGSSIGSTSFPVCPVGSLIVAKAARTWSLPHVKLHPCSGPYVFMALYLIKLKNSLTSTIQLALTGKVWIRALCLFTRNLMPKHSIKCHTRYRQSVEGELDKWSSSSDHSRTKLKLS